MYSTQSGLSDFEFIAEKNIEVLDIQVKKYIDRKTLAKHYHFACDDDNKVFMVALRTLPMDSTGVAHILEHTVLCGSKQFPVRDPFFLMLRRSLSNFMNAFTASDWTAYPFATQNSKDYDNLLKVYLDAVFFPNLNHLDFLQEGWRYDFSEPENITSDLIYKGIVFNEMKGAMSSPIRQLWHTVTKNLFSKSTYHHNSGGEPLEIPNLSYDALINFHKMFYHPSNATFFTYGNSNEKEIQHQINQQVLQHFEPQKDIPAIFLEKDLSEHKKIVSYYPVEEKKEKDTHIVLAWLLNENYNIDNLLEAHFLNLLLFDNSSSPMKLLLENTDLGEAPSPLCGLEDELHQMVMVIGLEGCHENAEEPVSALILQELERLAKNGIDHQQIQAAMHLLELSQREISGGGMPFGLNLLLEVTSAAIHDYEIFDLLEIDNALKKLRKKITNKDFVKKLCKNLLENNNRISVVMKADTQLAKKTLDKELKQLKIKEQTLDNTQKQEILALNQYLQKRQAEEPDVNILPTVTIDDIQIEQNFILPQKEQKIHKNKRYFAYSNRSNGLIYSHCVCHLPPLNLAQFKQIPILSSLLAEIGNNDKNYQTIQNQMALYTGGIKVTNQLWQPLKNNPSLSEGLNARLIFSVHALEYNKQQSFTLLQEIMEKSVFTEYHHIKDLISQWALNAQKGIISNGHLYAMQSASSSLSNNTQASNLWSGLTAIKSLIHLHQKSQKDKHSISDIMQDIEKLYQYIRAKWRQDWLLLADTKNLNSLVDCWQTVDWHCSDNNFQASPAINFGTQKYTKIAWSTNSQVNYCARAYQAVDIKHSDAATFSVLANYLRNEYLHTSIREQGGAYGGGCQVDFSGKTFRFFSYRDPRIEETFEDFQQSLEQLYKSKIETRKLHEAMLNSVSKITAPTSPSSTVKQDFYAHLEGIDKQYRENKIKAILNTKAKDLQRIVEQYFINKPYSDCVITNKKQIEKLKNQGFEIEHI